jgi:filamentous hemagglutinin family protein
LPRAFADTASAQAVPTNGTVTAGAATITTGTNSVSVNQTSQRAIIDWTTFNIGNGASVQFVQPGATSIAVNRVGLGGGASAIDGTLGANGHVMLLNPNGVMFGATAVVNVAGLIASTGNINDAQFMASATAPVAITGATGGSISNQGEHHDYRRRSRGVRRPFLVERRAHCGLERPHHAGERASSDRVVQRRPVRDRGQPGRGGRLDRQHRHAECAGRRDRALGARCRETWCRG